MRKKRFYLDWMEKCREETCNQDEAPMVMSPSDICGVCECAVVVSCFLHCTLCCSVVHPDCCTQCGLDSAVCRRCKREINDPTELVCAGVEETLQDTSSKLQICENVRSEGGPAQGVCRNICSRTNLSFRDGEFMGSLSAVLSRMEASDFPKLHFGDEQDQSWSS